MTTPLPEESAPPKNSGEGAQLAAEVVSPKRPSGPEDQERDVWWGAYSGRAMLPSLVACVLWTVGIAVLAWYHAALGFSWDTARYLTYGLVGAVWLFQTVRWLYRTAGYTYRLTTQRLFLFHGFLYPPGSVIELSQISGVAAEQRPWERWLGVGRVRILRGNAALPPVVLRGVAHPGHVAALIERRVPIGRVTATIGQRPATLPAANQRFS